MSRNSENTMGGFTADDDPSPNMRKKSPSSKRRGSNKHGVTKTTEVSDTQLPHNIKNAEGTNTNSFYYVSGSTESSPSHVTRPTANSISIQAPAGLSTETSMKKLEQDVSWDTHFSYQKSSAAPKEYFADHLTSFSSLSQSEDNSTPGTNKGRDTNEVLYEFQNMVPGGFPFLKSRSSSQNDKTSEEVKDSSPNLQKKVPDSPTVSRFRWLQPKYLRVFDTTKSRMPSYNPCLPKSVLDEIELSVNPDIQEAFCLMREGETLQVFQHSRIMTRTVSAECQLQKDMIHMTCFWNRCVQCCKVKKNFDIRDMIMARPGRDGLLRSIRSDLPETRCFSIVFNDRRESVNFLAPTEESARCWVRGINCIKKKFDTLLPRLREELFLWEIFQKADGDNDGELTYEEVYQMFEKKGATVTKAGRDRISKSFSNIATNDKVDFDQFVEYYHEASLLPEYEAIFSLYSADTNFVTAREIYRYLQECQKDLDVTESDCHRIIEEYEMKKEIREKKQMTVHGFVSFLLSPNCDIFNHRHDKVYQDMKHPLSHYFIASSHNTYLTADQLRGPSSTDAYMKALLQGCRCVELDCWDGVDHEPSIFHGHTLTSKIKFKDTIEVIGKYAFEASRYPLILSIENHCCIKQQRKMAKYMKRILGAELLTEHVISESDEVQLPSPAALEGKILIKGKKLPSVMDDLDDSSDGGDVSDEDEAAEMDQSVKVDGTRARLVGLLQSRSSTGRYDVSKSDHSRDTVKKLVDSRRSTTSPTATPTSSNQSSARIKEHEKKLKLSKELSDQVIYCKSIKFKGIDQDPAITDFKEMSSFSENKAHRLATHHTDKTIQFHVEHLNRTYPGASRTDSSNYDPQPLWNGGFQIVALNYQTKCPEMNLYHGKFRQNGRCGYILKPEFMTSPDADDVVKTNPSEMTIHLICGSNIPVSVSEDHFLGVEISIVGDKNDNSKKRTTSVLNNGYNPIWKEALSFEVDVPSMAMVWIKVYDGESDEVGHFVLPFSSVSEGYRIIHLLDEGDSPIRHSYLLVHVTVRQCGPLQTNSSSSSQSSRSSRSK